MARLRIRVELSRGGQGVPLHKLSGVVEEARKFFEMLSEDVHIDVRQGEWLGVDFDRDSLNFTAEYVGPVTAGQVDAFHAAFAGTTSLRRGTIAQFARITDAIGEEELVGFGLYQSEEINEPTEWRCLSRRDALQISQEIQYLADTSEAFSGDSHLPAVRDPDLGARLFGDRRDRAVEHTRWAEYVREVESNLSSRLTRVENTVQKHTGLIGDLRTQAAATEESFRGLLSAVESFCNQAAQQIERIPTAGLQAPPPRAAVAGASAGDLSSTAGPFPAQPLEAHAASSLEAEAPLIQNLHAAEEQPRIAEIFQPGASSAAAAAAPARAAQPFEPDPAEDIRAVFASAASSMESSTQPEPAAPSGFAGVIHRLTRPENGMLLALTAAVACIVIVLGAWLLWPSHSGPSLTQNVSAESSPTPAAAKPAAAPAIPAAAPSADAANASAPARKPGEMELVLESTEPVWISLTDATGDRVLSQLLVPGSPRTVMVQKSATLRVGNAGGLSARLNGKPIGTIGAHGKVMDVVFSNGSFRVVPVA